jgi:hypothetical protein
MSNVYNEFVYGGFLGVVNLLVSALIYYSTKLEANRKAYLEYELTTRRASLVSLPSSFTYISIFTGILNTGGAYLRSRRIYFLEFPTIPSFTARINDVDAGATEEFMGTLEAEWIVAVNDWMSLFLAILFLLAACFNFATVRQLYLRDRWVKEMLLPVFRPNWRALNRDEKTAGLVSGQGFVFLGEKDRAAFVNRVQEDGKSFAVYSPICTKRVSSG